MTRRLYVVVRSDLSTGQQAVQACHAIRAFTQSFPEEAADTLVLVEVHDEAALHALARDVQARRLRHSIFVEPDLDNSMTAIAIGPEGKSACRQLPLALAS